MADMCMYDTIHGDYPNCNGACKKGKGKYCQYYLVDSVCSLIRKWKEEAHVDSPVLIRKDNNRKKLIIYTTKPGYLIGYHGELYYKYVDKLRPIMTNRFIDHNGEPELGNDFIEFVECNDAI